MNKWNVLLLVFVSLFLVECSGSVATTDLLPEGTFTSGMEGPAVDQTGNLCAVNYQKEGTIGVVYPDGKHDLFVTLPEGSTGNGIRFDSEGLMYVADYTGHNILTIDPYTQSVTVFAHEPRMNQPNDLTIAPNGNLYASDPDWANSRGKLWLIRPDGSTECLEEDMGTTNGVEVSPDGQTLYVNESAQLTVWAYKIGEDGGITDKRLFHTFKGYGMDGMRCDEAGNLYLCRYDKGTVAILSPTGVLLHEVQLTGKKPSNITWGGKNNPRWFVTLQDRGCFESFESPVTKD